MVVTKPGFRGPAGAADDVLSGKPILRVIIGAVICAIEEKAGIQTERTIPGVRDRKIAGLGNQNIAFHYKVIFRALALSRPLKSSAIVVNRHRGLRDRVHEDL